MQLKTIRSPLAEEIKQVDDYIIAKLHSNVGLINQLGEYIVDAGGKRLRPLLVLLTAKTAGYQGNLHIALAAIVEFIHTATLLHDDVVDASLLRRGQDTANAIWGDKASVLVGDFLYSRAFQMLVEVGSMPMMQLFAQTTNAIAEGEVLQLQLSNEFHSDVTNYFKVIEHKTAILFACAAKIGGMLSNLSEKHHDALYQFGLQMGLAYQIVDDALDYKGDPNKIGKNLGDDLSEGKITLPILYAFENSSAATQTEIKKIMENKDLNKLSILQTHIQETGSLEKTFNKAYSIKNQAVHTLEALDWPNSTQALHYIAEFAVTRDF